MTTKQLASVKSSCGRQYLEIAGIAIAMEGDPFRGTLPEDCLEPIPDYELETAMIGDKPAKELPVELVRFFRGEKWTTKMLERAAYIINMECHDK